MADGSVGDCGGDGWKVPETSLLMVGISGVLDSSQLKVKHAPYSPSGLVIPMLGAPDTIF